MNPCSKMTDRLRMLLENYITAREEGPKEGYDIRQVDQDNFEHYYILLKPRSGIYKDQYHILELKTQYGKDNNVSRYPYQAPYIRFLTSVFHTNVSDHGSICLDILKDINKWSPLYDFNAIVTNIVALLNDPNNISPYNPIASRLYVDCENKYVQLKKNIPEASLNELEQLKDECFASFKQKADAYANTNKIEFYTKWFPQILGENIDNSDMSLLKDMFELLKPKKKKKATETKSVVETSLVQTTASENPAAQTTTKTQTVETSTLVPVPTAPSAKPPRWAKYQKKIK